MPGTPEDQIAAAIIRYLETTTEKCATIREIRANLPNFIQLNAHDLKPSPTRPGEQLWEQIVRNVVCHREDDDNAVHDGLLVYVKRGQLALPDSK